MVTRQPLGLILLCLLLGSPVGTTQAATFSAHVDRKSMTRDETLVLELTLSDSDTRLRAEGEQPDIDLTLLSRDFELGTPRERHRFNVERNRGRATSTLHVELFPRHTGELTIPAFTVDGLRSRPITVRVLKADPERARELFVRTGVVKDRLWVHETTLLYLDLYQRVDIESARLGGLPDTDPKNIGLERIGSRDRTETVNGLEYQVNRTAWGLAPRQAGAISIHMPDVWVVTKSGERRRLPFSDIGVAAKALPAGVPNDIIVGRPELAFDVAKGPVEADTPIAVRLTLRSPTLPELMPATPPTFEMPAGIRTYHEKTAIEGTTFGRDGQITTTVRYPMQLLPDRGGRFRLPEITLPYFDTDKGAPAVASLPGPTLDVYARSASEEPATASPVVTAPLSPASDQALRMWRSISLGLGLLWAATLIVAWWHMRSRTTSPPPPRTAAPDSGPGGGTPVDRLLAAMGTRTLEAGLIAWEKRFGVDPARREVVRAVQQARYAADGLGEDALQRAVDELLAGLPVAPSRQDQADPWRPESFTPTGRLGD